MRQFKVRDSWGVYDTYKELRRNKWKDTGFKVTEKQFYTIVRRLNEELAEQLLQGKRVTLPERMGHLEITKKENVPYFKNDRLVITHPVDWKRTNELWIADEEAREKKILVHRTEQFTYKITYNKFRANYQNKVFYLFSPMRGLKRELAEKINNNETDTIW